MGERRAAVRSIFFGGANKHFGCVRAAATYELARVYLVDQERSLRLHATIDTSIFLGILCAIIVVCGTVK